MPETLQSEVCNLQAVATAVMAARSRCSCVISRAHPNPGEIIANLARVVRFHTHLPAQDPSHTVGTNPPTVTGPTLWAAAFMHLRKFFTHIAGERTGGFQEP